MQAVKISYINDDQEQGILYDWEKIKKEYQKLKCPKRVYNPLKVDIPNFGYIIAMSERSEGKTTNPLLVGMIMHQMYGTIIHYVRNRPDMITPKAMKDIFTTILQYHYIEKITDGEWNNVFYYGKRWYYCNTDETGRIIEKCPQHFMFCCTLPESDYLKSSYTCPVGDLIILDEFVMLDGYGYSDFVHFSDICKTIIRDRTSAIVYMLSNSVDVSSPWFDELCIRDEANTMQQGESRQIVTCEGTHIFFEMLEKNTSEKRSAVNQKYFGFPNPKLAAITGKGTWAVESYPHIRRIEDDEDFHVLQNRLFVRQSGKLLKLQLVKDRTGFAVYVTPATRTYNDSVILTLGEIREKNEVYGFGAKGTMLDVYWRLYKANRFFYATNIDGAIMRAYIRQTIESNRNRGTF